MSDELRDTDDHERAALADALDGVPLEFTEGEW